jgi:protein SCO1/2
VTVSIDPDEGPALAAQKQAAYHQLLGRDDVRWSFLTGSQDAIHQLADSVGFRYRYDPDSDTFAHVPAIFFLSPDGKLSRYLYGLVYTATDLKFALMDASQGVIGSTVDRIIQICFHFVNGTYAPFAFGVMRLGGILIAVCLGVFLLVHWRRERHRRAETTT